MRGRPSYLRAFAVACSASIAVVDASAQSPAIPIRPIEPDTPAQAEPEPPPLAIGDRAPRLEVAHWIAGAPITAFEDERVSVVVFWASWCGASRAVLRRMPDIERLRDARVVCISDEAPEAVEAWLAGPDRPADATIAIGADPDGRPHRAYLRAAGVLGVPFAFIVGTTGRIEWFGPAGELDAPLAAILEGRWDAADFKRRSEARRAAEREKRAQHARLVEATRQRDWETVLALHDAVLAHDPDDLDVLDAKMRICLSSADRPDEGYAIARLIEARSGDDPARLHAVARFIVDPNVAIRVRDAAVARGLAERAATITTRSDAAILATLARAHWLLGDTDRAVVVQTEALARAKPEERPVFEAALAEFRASR
jgi:thiol-disulfide isomerase/thioredoxin